MHENAIDLVPFDQKFREVVSEYIRKAKKSIKIVTGEISAYNYFDLRKAAEEAAEKGIDIKVYANAPDRNISNRLIHHNIHVYIGNEVFDDEHFTIIDDKGVIVSRKNKGRKMPAATGMRKGYVIKNNPEVIKHIKLFERLLKSSKKEKTLESDPIFNLAEKPLRLGQLSEEYAD